METKDKGVAKAAGETDGPASSGLPPQNVPPETAVQYRREENVTLCE